MNELSAESASQRNCIAFDGHQCVAAGLLKEVASKVKAFIELNSTANVLIFDQATSELVEVDFRGTLDDVLQRLPKETPPGETEKPRGPGRPKLGVIPREVTLLPRHWDWLAAQPGGASVAIRKLVEQARRTHADQDRVRLAREATYRFISAMAGDEEGFEEATRALFAGNQGGFNQSTASWPTDIQAHACKLAAATFPPKQDGKQ